MKVQPSRAEEEVARKLQQQTIRAREEILTQGNGAVSPRDSPSTTVKTNIKRAGPRRAAKLLYFSPLSRETFPLLSQLLTLDLDPRPPRQSVLPS